MRMSIGDSSLTPEIVAFFYSAVKELYSYFVAAESFKSGIGMWAEEIMYTVTNGVTMVYSVWIIHICFMLVVPVIACETQLT